jgi:hypothetical protein
MLADAWEEELRLRDADRSVLGYVEAESMFYTGAAALLAILAARPIEERCEAMRQVQEELWRYAQDKESPE